MGGWLRVRGLYDESIPVLLLVFDMLAGGDWKIPSGEWGGYYICDDNGRFLIISHAGGNKVS